MSSKLYPVPIVTKVVTQLSSYVKYRNTGPISNLGGITYIDRRPLKLPPTLPLFF